MVPAKESNIFNQYSPAPVQKIKPTKKQIKQTTPATNQLSLESIKVQGIEYLTCDVLFPYPLEYINIEYGTEHPLQDSDLWSYSERQEHHEEDHSPEGGAR